MATLTCFAAPSDFPGQADFPFLGISGISELPVLDAAWEMYMASLLDPRPVQQWGVGEPPTEIGQLGWLGILAGVLPLVPLDHLSQPLGHCPPPFSPHYSHSSSAIQGRVAFSQAWDCKTGWKLAWAALSLTPAGVQVC